MSPSNHERDNAVIRIYSSSATTSPKSCPTYLAAKTDYSVKRSERKKSSRFASMAFSPFSAVLELVENYQVPLDEAFSHLPLRGDAARDIAGELIAPLHEGLLAWTHDAVRNYLRALEEDRHLQAAVGLRPAGPWVRQYPSSDAVVNSRTRELCAWGRGYIYRHGNDTVRELRIPAMGKAGAKRRADAELATAAHVLATGSCVDRDVVDRKRGPYRGGKPFPLLPFTASSPAAALPSRVRLVEIGCVDGLPQVLYDDTTEAAESFFISKAADTLSALHRPVTEIAGRDCLDCKIRSECRRLHSAPGFLDIRDSSHPRRIWSATTGRYFDDCPAKAHFRALSLPPDEESEKTAFVRRGDAVHAWLKRLHSRKPRRPCAPDDLPESPDSWSAGEWTLEGEHARHGAAMLAAHLEVCPFLDTAPDSIAYPEQTVAADDRHADVLIVADADLLYRRDGSWVYRELKTTAGDFVADGADLLTRYQQLALAVLLFKAGAIPAGPRSAVELELLTPVGPDIRVIDPNSTSVQERARDTIHGLTRRWHADEEYLPTPSEKACGRCSYQRWCPVSPRNTPDRSAP
ncbi:PD-(D/E)XK nuclease family protein [Nonomuraea jiangxiensis]|uniref:PD-(D/E)XK nuclease superfamily protein n=1 Tax=Nonomuraea jiangxiensis TaxID=633440 RepID=A0A1G8TCF2_9ACTN|nr:PD-(D/E)XK nuclease family protein [Nonomuraea jiangxiensis]SDJ39272.1 PD-(D/E)XK nuclease superfamily protein [Nonomuraea jiangxiensis]